jgi:hypothetical protein
LNSSINKTHASNEGSLYLLVTNMLSTKIKHGINDYEKCCLEEVVKRVWMTYANNSSVSLVAINLSNDKDQRIQDLGRILAVC